MWRGFPWTQIVGWMTAYCPFCDSFTRADSLIGPYIAAFWDTISRMSASTLGSGDLTPRMMVLGLVIQREDTVAGVARRLADQFASARFPRSSEHKNLKPRCCL